jgi:hypothetical protein
MTKGLAKFLQDHPHHGGIIWLPDLNAIYMKPGRTAGTSLLRGILEPQTKAVHFKDHRAEFYDWLNNVTDESLQDVYIFSAVRNPWDRFVSIATAFKIPVDDLLAHWGTCRYGLNVYQHCLPLTWYTAHVDRVLWCETFESNVRSLSEKLGFKVPDEFPKRNVTQHPHYTDVLTKAQAEKIEGFYWQDITEFSYGY